MKKHISIVVAVITLVVIALTACSTASTENNAIVSTSELTTTEATTTEPTTTEPTTTEATTTEPSTTKPSTSKPSTTKPGTTKPTVTEPTVTEPTVTEPTVTEPTVTEPTVTEPTVTEPTATEPTETEPVVTRPGDLYEEEMPQDDDWDVYESYEEVCSTHQDSKAIPHTDLKCVWTGLINDFALDVYVYMDEGWMGVCIMNDEGHYLDVYGYGVDLDRITEYTIYLVDNQGGDGDFRVSVDENVRFCIYIDKEE